MTIIQNVRIIDAQQDFIGHIAFDDRIVYVQDAPLTLKNATNTIDGTGCIVMPSFVDPHVHFRTPGLEHKEDFLTGSKSALAGGVTMVFDMPNTIPPVFTQAILNDKINAVKRLQPYIHYGFFFGANDSNIKDIKKVRNVAGIKLYLNDTTGHLLLSDRKVWAKILKTGHHITAHAEGETFLELVALWEKLGMPCSLHLAHMTLEQELQEIIRLKKNKSTRHLISCEVCPHHLFFNNEDVRTQPYLRMKPELATEQDRVALWQGIEAGWIDCFATDHAPHLLSEKTAPQPAFGVPGVATLFPLLFTEWQKKGWDVKKLSRMLTYNALRIYPITRSKGLLKKKYDADLVIFNPKTKYTIQAHHLHSKCGWTPFENNKVVGKIKSVYVGGERLFHQGRFAQNADTNKAVEFKMG